MLKKIISVFVPGVKSNNMRELVCIVAFLAGCLIGAAVGFSHTKKAPSRFIAKGIPIPSENKTTSDESKRPTLVRIELSSKESGHLRCSGAIITKEYLLTAAHCLYDAKPGSLAVIYDMKGADTTVTGTIAAYDPSTDLGLITGDFSSFNTLRLLTDHLGMLPEGVYMAYGFPRGQKTATGARVTPSGLYYDFVRVIGIPFFPGQSGGPVIDIQDADIVGVISAIASNGTGIVATPVGLWSIFNLE